MSVREFAKRNDITIVGKLKKAYIEEWNENQMVFKRIPFYFDESGAEFVKVKHPVTDEMVWTYIDAEGGC